MDVDAYVAASRQRWDRLDQLIRRAGRPRGMSGQEIDELVDSYQRAATSLSVLRSSGPDPALLARLSSLVARARSVITGVQVPAWQVVAYFFAVIFPAAAYRARWWWAGATLGSLLVAYGTGAWVASTPEVQAAIGTPAEIRQMVEHDFADYYSSDPAASFAARVWTNNAWVAAGSLALGILLGLPTLYILATNSLNVGVAGGLMVAYGKGSVFFGLILPHGMLELTAVFLAAAAGLRLGWTVIDPGHRRRVDALAEEGRSAVTIAVGLVLVLFISGLVEAFVTPSGLPTAARIAIGVVAEVAFLAYVLVLGRRAARAGITGDLELGLRPDTAPVAG